MSFLVVANWKMNGTRSSFIKFITRLNGAVNSSVLKLVICPPFTALPDNIKMHDCIGIGAQNCHYKKSGSYTGEVSAEMLKELGCEYVILGHSERSFEVDSEILLKSEAALEVGLHPIICIGESYDEYVNGKTVHAIQNQCVHRLPKHGEYTVAYEPIWAIGSGIIPSVDAIFDVIEVVKSHADCRCVIYGGSVNLDNISQLLSIKNLSGVLIGSASLEFDTFFKIASKSEKVLYKNKMV